MESTSMKGKTEMSGTMEKDQKIASPECVMRPTQDLLLPSHSKSTTSQLNANFHVIITTFH